jgi:alpha-amylase
MAGPEGPLVRGAHWRNFLAKYSESNRMHKKMQALSFLARARGDQGSARRAIGRAQCNDAYWHGVFGGLYLPHLREAIWRNLALAERDLRRNESLAAEVTDLDGDGYDEIWIHSDQFSAIVSPRRGGAVEEYTLFATETNYANILTRRREAYHDLALEERHEVSGGDGGTPSIHDIEEGIRLERRPPADPEDRALFLERVLGGALSLEQYSLDDYSPVRSWAGVSGHYRIEQSADAVEIGWRTEGLTKSLRFSPEGALAVQFSWDSSVGSEGDWFTTELSLFAALESRTEPAAEIWTFPIETVAKSERGLDRTRQGDSVTFRWPVRVGAARVELQPPEQARLAAAVGDQAKEIG